MGHACRYDADAVGAVVVVVDEAVGDGFSWQQLRVECPETHLAFHFRPAKSANGYCMCLRVML